jgi:hypothetical protein
LVTDYEIQCATAYVKATLTGDEATVDFETYNKGFWMWWQHVKVTNYDNLEADQILRLVISYEDEGELGAIAIEKENSSKLYVEDFDKFIMRARGKRHHSLRTTRLEAFKKALTVSPVNVASHGA